MHKGFLQIAAVLASISVLLGAFAAHGLKKILAESELATFETAVRYQFYHVFALFITGIVFYEMKTRMVKWAGYAFITGIVLFSGSLYLLVFFQSRMQTDIKWLGAITPFGGLAFIGGWILLFVSFLKRTGNAKQ